MARIKGDGLEEHHLTIIPSTVLTQKDQARDLHLIFTDKVTVKFILKDNTVETPARRWCNICK
jgi:hypothetical protein